MYSHDFKRTLEYFKNNIPEKTNKFLSGCGFSEHGLEKVCIAALNNLLYKKEIPLIQPARISNLKLLFLILISFSYCLVFNSIVIFINKLILRNGSSGELLIERTKKVIFWSDMSPSSFKPFFFLNKKIPNSFLTTCISQKHFFMKRNTNTHYFFYAHSNINSALNSVAFVVFHLPAIIRVIGTNSSFSSLLKFCIEFPKAILVYEKVSLMVGKNKFLKDMISIFPHDTSPFYSSMIDLFNQNNIPTALIVHGGCFFENNIILVPSMAKYVITSSNREKLFYKEIYNSKSYSFGIPLQLFVEKNIFIDDFKSEKKYDVLILGSYGPQWENLVRLRSLRGLARCEKQNKILLRHHPSADNKSKLYLESFLEDSKYRLSSNTSLDEDISSAEIVISFSVDSNITCLLNRKQTIYCAFPDTDIPSRLQKWENLLYIVSTESEMLEILNEVLRQSYKPTKNNSPDYYRAFIEEFGEFDEQKILKNLNGVINEIQYLENV